MSDKGYQFVCKLFNDYQFKGTQWEVDTQMDNYYNFIKSKEEETGKEYDYDRVYKLLEREYKKKILPTKFELVTFMNRAVVNNFDSTRDGQLLVFLCYRYDEENKPIFKRIYEFVIDNQGEKNKSVSTYEYQLKDRYELVKSKFFPAGATLMGDYKNGYTVYYPPTESGIHKEVLVSESEVA